MGGAASLTIWWILRLRGGGAESSGPAEEKDPRTLDALESGPSSFNNPLNPPEELLKTPGDRRSDWKPGGYVEDAVKRSFVFVGVVSAHGLGFCSEEAGDGTSQSRIGS